MGTMGELGTMDELGKMDGLGRRDEQQVPLDSKQKQGIVVGIVVVAGKHAMDNTPITMKKFDLFKIF